MCLQNKIVKCAAVLLIIIAPHTSASELSDLDPILSQHTLGFFVQAAECLSIKASLAEKKQFISAYQELAKYKKPDELYFNLKEMEKHQAMSSRDTNAIHTAIKKHCPYTHSLIETSIRKSGLESQIMLKVILENLIVSYMSVQVVDSITRDKAFRTEHTPIGLTISPY